MNIKHMMGKSTHSMNGFLGSSLVVLASILIYCIRIHLTNKKPLKPYDTYHGKVSVISFQVHLLIPAMITRWAPTPINGLTNR